MAATISAGGRTRLEGADSILPQADSAFIGIGRQFGAKITQRGKMIYVDAKNKAGTKLDSKIMGLDLKDSPDLAPVIACLAAAQNRRVRMDNVGRLRFKESDRLGAVSTQLEKMGVKVKEAKNSMFIIPSSSSPNAVERRKPIVLDPSGDHRILMGLVVAGLSGRFGKLLISNPGCVKKSYPDFISQVQKLAHDDTILNLVEG